MQRKDSILVWALGLGAIVSAAVTYRITILQQHFGGGICGDEAPTFLWLFDLSSAPGLLFYAYMPMAAIATLFGLVLLQRKHRSRQSALLVSTLLLFVLWVLCILAQWVASYHTVLMYAWQLIAMLEAGLYVAAFYFAYVYLHDRDLPYWVKVLLTAILLAVAAVTPTVLNIPQYDSRICAGTTQSWLWNVLYFVVEPALIVALAGTGVAAFRREKSVTRRPHIVLFTFSFTVFMSLFAVSNYYGELTTDYEMNFWGPLGLLVCLLISGYMVMQRMKFHWHTLVAQVLVWGLVTLIGTQFFYLEGTTPFVLNSAAFLATILFGLMMIRAATVEIRQQEAETALIRQRDALERLLAGGVKDALVAASQPALVSRIDEIRTADTLRLREVAFDRSSVNLTEIGRAVAAGYQADAAKKGLTIATELPEEPLLVIGDTLWLKRVAQVLVENAIAYSAKGTITVGVKKQGSSALLWVKDEGIGLLPTDYEVLFTEGGHGADAAKTNPNAMGYGLYIAKLVVEAHNGRIWAESAGPDKGATFSVELPA